MVRGVTRALGGAVSAARRAVSRGGEEQAEAPAKKAPAKKAPAKKAPAKKKSPTTPSVSASSDTMSPAAAPAAPTRTATTAPAPKAATVKKASPTVEPSDLEAAEHLVVKEGEDAWTPEELQEVLTELTEQRAHSAEIVAEHEAELTGLMRDSGDGAGQDQADVGASTFERDHEMSVLHNERDKVAQIDRALARIADGSYGQCESCGQPIGKLRLMAFPRATLCMTCKQREERR